MLNSLSGIEVTTVVRSASAALTWLKRQPYDVLLLELSLHSGTALRVLQALTQHRHRTLAVPPCIVLSNSPNEVVRRHCQSLGAQAVFDKSVQLDELFAFLRRHYQSLH